MEGLDQEIDLTLRLGLPNQPQENQEAPQGLMPQRNFSNIPRFYHQAIWRSGILPNAGGIERNRSLGRLINHRPWPLRTLELVRNNWTMSSNSLLLRRYQQHLQQRYQQQHQQLRCKICETTETPLWRKGPDGPRTLCNRCGLRYARALKRG